MSFKYIARYFVAACALLGSAAGAQQATTPSPPPATNISPPILSRVPFVSPNRSSGSPALPLPGREFAQSKYYQNAYQQVQEYGRCLTHVGPTRARELLNSDPNTVDERLAYRILVGVGRPCLPYGYHPPATFLRGGLAEAMYLRGAEAGVPVDHRPTADEVTRFYSAEATRSDARLIDDRRFTALANCLVVNAPEKVHLVLLTRHGSAGERKALQQVLDQSPSCASDRRLTNTAATTFVRAYIAESAYRWSQLAG